MMCLTTTQPQRLTRHIRIRRCVVRHIPPAKAFWDHIPPARLSLLLLPLFLEQLRHMGNSQFLLVSWDFNPPTNFTISGTLTPQLAGSWRQPISPPSVSPSLPSIPPWSLPGERKWDESPHRSTNLVERWGGWRRDAGEATGCWGDSCHDSLPPPVDHDTTRTVGTTT